MYDFKVVVEGAYADQVRFWELLPLEVWVTAAPAGLPTDRRFTLGTMSAAKKLISGVDAAIRENYNLKYSLLIFSEGQAAAELQKIAEDLGVTWLRGKAAA